MSRLSRLIRLALGLRFEAASASFALRPRLFLANRLFLSLASLVLFLLSCRLLPHLLLKLSLGLILQVLIGRVR